MRMKLAHILPSNLVILELKDSKLKDEDPMATIGAMQLLKLLRLSNSYLGTTFACKCGSFPQLEELYLANLKNLNEWTIEEESLSCLKKLEILRCKQLMRFPKGLLFVTTLVELEYFGMPKEFGQQASGLGWSPRYRLPHYFETIVEQCDTLVDTSSMNKLYEHLTAGVFLNNKRQKYWIIKQEDGYHNCFMLYAIDLFPLPLDDGLSLGHLPYSCYEYIKMAESDGTLIEVIQVQQPFGCNGFIRGKFDTRYLSMGITYEVAFVIMLLEAVCARPIPPATCGMAFGRPSLGGGPPQRHEHLLDDKPKDEWIRLLAGRSKMARNTGKLEISLRGIQPGAIIKGVIIEPVF
uniref:Uncharacterized protein n=2 Tax=Opuntia streptacantha TaxID=393608 RepID=A0A7C9D9W5_OPUST